MPDPVTAVVGGTALVGGYMQSKAAKKAAGIQAGAYDRATQAELSMYYQSREDMAPWREAGEEALNELVEMVKAGPGEYEKSPYYDFLMGEGTQALESGAAAKGKQLSGAENKALIKYGQNIASTDYDNWLRRYYETLTPYQSLSNVGQTTGAQMGQLGVQTGQQVGQNVIGAGGALATGQINQGNIWANAISGMGQNVLDYYMAKKMGLFNRSGGYGANTPSGYSHGI